MAAPLLLTALAAVATVGWLVFVFHDVPLRYVSMLGGREVAQATDATCPAVSPRTIDALRSRSILPLVIFGLLSLAAVVAGARWAQHPGDRSPVVLLAGAVSTALGVALTYAAVTLDSLANLGLSLVAPVIACLLLLAAVLLRSPRDANSAQVTFTLVHGAIVALIVPSAVAWLTATNDVFVCL